MLGTDCTNDIQQPRSTYLSAKIIGQNNVCIVAANFTVYPPLSQGRPKRMWIVAAYPMPFRGYNQKNGGWRLHIPCHLGTTLNIRVDDGCVSPVVSGLHPEELRIVALYPLLSPRHTQKGC
uniref:Uncharacterized protein n=1 Tax=Eutreptiella gymnastica TaxID=73025 RepID=A0A7S4FF63_9EUGL